VNGDSDELENVASKEDDVLVALSYYKHRDVLGLQRLSCLCEFASLEVVCDVGLMLG